MHLYIEEKLHAVSRGEMTTLETIIDDFEFLDDWEDKYRYVIDLARDLEPYPDELRNEQTKVRGCVSQVWLTTKIGAPGADQTPVMNFIGDSDAMIVKGLIAVLLIVYSGKTAREIIDIDIVEILAKLQLNDHLTPQRSNGLASMVKRIRDDATNILANE